MEGYVSWTNNKYVANNMEHIQSTVLLIAKRRKSERYFLCKWLQGGANEKQVALLIIKLAVMRNIKALGVLVQ